MLKRSMAIAAMLSLTGLATGARAQEFCVVCTGPDAHYRCLIGGDAPPAARSSRGQFLCITELAQQGRHASCSAARAQATPCPGETRVVAFPAGELGPSPAAELPPAPQPPPGPPGTPAPQPSYAEPGGAPAPLPASPGEPPPAEPAETNAVQKLAKQTGEAISNSAQSAGNALKKTWNCMASLFGDC